MDLDHHAFLLNLTFLTPYKYLRLGFKSKYLLKGCSYHYDEVAAVAGSSVLLNGKRPASPRAT